MCHISIIIFNFSKALLFFWWEIPLHFLTTCRAMFFFCQRPTSLTAPLEGAPPDMSTSPLLPQWLPFDASQGDGMWAEPWFHCHPSRTLTSVAESFYAHAVALLRALLALAASDETQGASPLRPRSGRVVRVPAGGAVNIKVREPSPKKCLSISSPCSLSICFQ